MKKLIGIVAAAALLASAAFAELNMGAWIRTVTAPVASNGEDILSGWTNSWGYGIRNARIGFNWTSDDGKVGMLYDIFGDGSGGFGSGDYRAGWYQPADWVKFMVGHIDNGYTMRSDLCLPSWNWIRPVNWFQDDEGLTFTLGNANALQIELFPVEGLQILGRLAMPADGGFQDSYKMFETSTFAIGYTIGDIGTIKAAWSGNGYRKYKAVAGGAAGEEEDDDDDAADTPAATGDETKHLGDVQVAFDLVGVENLYITVGAKISIAQSDYKDAVKAAGDDFAFLKVALGASYQITDNFKVAASFAVQTYEVADPAYQFGVGIDVGLTDTLSLGADFRGLLANDEAYFSFLVGLGWGFSSNGSLGIGFQGTTNGNGFNAGANVIDPAKADAFSWAVPISFSYWF